MRVALATAEVVPAEFDDDDVLAEALIARSVEARFVAWDDRTADWASFDQVVIRSTWDYTARLDAFLAWAASLERRLRNPLEVVRWNSDKRYLADLDAAGIEVAPTLYVEFGDAIPDLDGEVVVKPTISAGARDTGRFGPGAHDQARRLLRRLVTEGRTAMVQPYLSAVDTRGETALVFVAGARCHALRKRAVLRPDMEAPVRTDALGAAEAMYDPDLVVAADADPAEERAAADVMAHLTKRFGTAPLYARVDLVARADGAPVVLELELVEPCLYLKAAPATADRLAGAVLAS